MRRDSRKPNRLKIKSVNDKIVIYASITVAVLSAVLIALMLYSRHLNSSIEKNNLDLKQMADIAEANRTNQNTQSASSEIGKSVEEAKNETNTTNTANTTNTTNTTSSSNTTNTVTNTSVASNTNSVNNTNTSTVKVNTKVAETKKELSFAKPVDGEIVKEYAKDNLVYSNTLEEWVTHLGIDIEAEKTTVVKSAEAGVVKSIKNDPRYGLTVVIEHDDGYQTVYSNLLTAEFVVEGEKVDKEQTIGTIGNTAAFESADEPHLHFEILKDSVQVDPNIYLK